MSNKIQITVSGILNDLQNGMTRTTKSKHYDSERGSIAEKYNLTDAEVKRLFQSSPKLQGRKTILPKEDSFILIDDTEETTNTVEITTDNTRRDYDEEEVVDSNPSAEYTTFN